MDNKNIYQHQVQVQVNKPTVNGLGIAGMIVGILALLLSCTIVGGILGFIGLALSICGFIPKNTGRGMTIAGTALNSVAMIFSLIITIISPFEEDNELKVSTAKPEERVAEISEEAKTDYEESYSVGSIIETNDSIITFISCGDYEVDNEYLLPKDGYKYVTAEFEIENTGNTDMTVSYYDFECYADGYSVDHAYVDDDNELSATISTGRKAKGTVNFEVPEDVEEIVLEYSPNIFSTKKIKFIVQ